jgi:Ca-activated chloride channel family protein
MTFAAPANLTLFLLVALLFGAVLWLERWRRRARRAFGGRLGRSNAGLPLQALVVIAAATLVVLAAARPFWSTRELNRTSRGIDLVVVLDVSLSMTAQDIKPTRIAVAEDDVAHLIDSMRGNRIGLVFFAGSSILRSPLSTDTAALTQIVRRADRTAGLTQPGSDLGAALDQAGRLLDASPAPGRAVVLVSDGEDFGKAATDKARELQGKGIVVFSAGVGTAAGSTLLDPSPRGRGQPLLKLDSQTGQPVVSHLDEANLQAIAGAGGGAYVRLTGSGRDLLGLRANLGQLQQSSFGAETQKVPAEKFQWFAGAALAFLGTAWFVPAYGLVPGFFGRRLLRTRAAPAITMLLIALIVAGACGSADNLRNQNASANELYGRGDYEGAVNAYESLLVARPDVPELAYNAGNALDRAGKYDRAVAETQRALPPTRPGLGVPTYYALGNHYLALGRLPDAFEAYRSALLLDPGDVDSKFNLELVLQRLKQSPPGQGQGQPGPSPNPDPNSSQPGPNAPDQPAQSAPDQSQPAQPGQAANPQRDLQQALSGLQDNLSFEDAVRILNLLDQLNANQRRQPGSQGASGGGPDY